MGNCLRGSTQDDVSLLRGGRREGRGDRPSRHHHHHRRRHHRQDSDSSPSHQVTDPNSSHGRSDELSEAEQIKKAKRLVMMQHLPVGIHDGSCSKRRECVICMIEFTKGDSLRYLPCLHIYHKQCIDDWLMRSFTCPFCMEPVEVAFFMTYFTH